MTRRFSAERMVSPIVAALLLASWELASRAGWTNPVLFPPPSAIAEDLWRLLVAGTLLSDTAVTAARVVAGGLAGCLPAAALGLVLGSSRRLAAAIDPIIAALHPLPKVALLPLLMVVFGIGETPAIVAVAISAFFPMIISTAAGVRGISPLLFEVVRSYGAGRGATIRRVVLPGSLPTMFSGLRIALNVALLVAIAVEFVAASHGLGTLIWTSWQTLRTEDLYVGLFVIACLGVGLNVALDWTARRVVRWQP